MSFSIALTVTFGLFLIELISLLLGATVLGISGEGVDIDIDADADFDMIGDIDIDAIDTDAMGHGGPAPSGFLTWIGARDVPFSHEIAKVNMKTLRLEVARVNEQSLITKDRMRVDVVLNFTYP